MANFRSRFSFNKVYPQLQQDNQNEQQNEDQQQQQQQQQHEPQQQQNPSAEYVKEDSRKSLYKKIFPNVNSFKNKVYPSKLFSADHVKVNENGPIIGNLDKFHTVNIYSNTYKETTKR